MRWYFSWPLKNGQAIPAKVRMGLPGRSLVPRLTLKPARPRLSSTLKDLQGRRSFSLSHGGIVCALRRLLVQLSLLSGGYKFGG